jgi:hypothetical protein
MKTKSTTPGINTGYKLKLDSQEKFATNPVLFPNFNIQTD